VVPAAVTPNQLPCSTKRGRAPEIIAPLGRNIATPRRVKAPCPSNSRKELNPGAWVISILSWALWAPGAGIVLGCAPGWV